MDAGVDGIAGDREATFGGQRRGLESGDVLGERGNSVALGNRLHDQPRRAGPDREPGRFLQETGGAVRRPRIHTHVGVDDDVPVDVRQPLRGQPAQRQQRFRVLIRVGLLGVAQRDAADPVLPEEQALEHAQRDQQAGWAELAHHAAAEAFDVRFGSGRSELRQQVAAAGPVRDRVLQRHPAVGQAVRDRAALGRVQAGLEQRGHDRLGAGRTVPDLHREVRPGDAVQHRSGDGRVVRDDGVPVELDPGRQRGARVRVVAHPRVAVERDRADRGRRRVPGGHEPGAHRDGIADTHPRLHHELARSMRPGDEVTERAGLRDAHEAWPMASRPTYDWKAVRPVPSSKTAPYPAAVSWARLRSQPGPAIPSFPPITVGVPTSSAWLRT